MKSQNRKKLNNTLIGLGFIGPNLLGFLAFTLIPLVISMVLAFSNWDIRFHNMFTKADLKFVGIDNFTRLFAHPDFWKFFGNTLFLMMGIPFAVAGSLGAALLLNSDFAKPKNKLITMFIAGAGLLISCSMLAFAGAGSGMTMLVAGLLVLILSGGILGGSTFYRTMFYVPYFTAGVATFILWKKLYDPKFGPINTSLEPVLNSLSSFVNSLPSMTLPALSISCAVFSILLLWWGCSGLRRMWRDGDADLSFLIFAEFAMLVPGIALVLLKGGPLHIAYCIAACVIVLFNSYLMFSKQKDFPCETGKGAGTVFSIGMGLLVAQFTLLGIGIVLQNLPVMSSDGLAPPAWLTDYNWAKPAIMIMGFWGAIGSNNMLLYLAGLSNIPVELHEAAEIDGASGMQKFWNVIWPQLAPITFFIFIMSVIGGLQGGFEMARAMTAGGPAGSTTTISYFVYNEGFSTGRLGYASAIAWTLFAMVFAITIFNWKFGNKHVNE
jgi:multiple sugar transport system permease protein